MLQAKRKLGPNTAEFEAVAKALNFSVLLLDGDTNIKFASAHAHELFGAKDSDELRSEWRNYFDRLKIPDLLPLEKNNKPLYHRSELQTEKSTRRLRMEIYPLRHDKCDCYVIYARDREVLADSERELLFASHHYVQRYLISTLVHDLNAPINTMRITLELVERTLANAGLDVANESKVKWERYRNILNEELSKLKVQVADIPNLFDMSDNAILAFFDIRSVIESVAKFVKHEAASRNIRRELELPDNAVLVYGREAELRLALLNLAVSLVEATKQGGKLQFSTASQNDFSEILLRGDLVEVNQLSICDDQPMTSSPEGNSLGIFVARLIIEAHGGEIKTHISVENESVVIQVILPRSATTKNPNLN